ncbi:MAG: hypothetical protein PHE09_13530 [Oscillospiraceae bacterium]|nr:hypothetical protein [Oscillospiraceae bacterium]
MKSVIFSAAGDYFVTRKLKNHLVKLFVAGIPGIAAWFVLRFIKLTPSVKIDEVFSGFVNIQISAIAILISFSIAIITIMVSADNENIRKIKDTQSTECKKLKRADETMSLFQVLLSNITYNVFVEAVYLVLLIFCIFLQMFIGEGLIKIIMAVCVFFVVHIFHVLLESVGQMYLTFWKN